jgi:aminocarboxymuconate-semialdehyde decarboxylase
MSKDLTVIDVHNHIVPANFPAPPPTCLDRWPIMELRGGDQASVMIGGKEFRLVDSRCWDSKRRVDDMDRERVRIQALSPMPELLSYWIDKQDALAMSRYTNHAISELIQSAPKRFVGLGMVPMQDPELAARELGSFRSEYGLCGVEIGSNILRKSPGDPSFDVFFAEAEKYDLAIFIHALHPTMTDRLIGPQPLAAMVAFPTDTGLAAASLVTTRTLDKFPKLRIAFSHGGGTFASFLPRLQNGWRNMPVLNKAFSSPTEIARRFFYDDLVFDPDLLRYLIATFGASQIMVGSDYPFTAGEPHPVDWLDSVQLSQKERALLTSGAARRFLNLPATF